MRRARGRWNEAAGEGPSGAVCAASMPLAGKHYFLTMTRKREKKIIT